MRWFCVFAFTLVTLVTVDSRAAGAQFSPSDAVHDQLEHKAINQCCPDEEELGLRKDFVYSVEREKDADGEECGDSKRLSTDESPQEAVNHSGRNAGDSSHHHNSERSR